MNTSGTVPSDAYREALSWLYDRIDYERTRPAGQNPFRLERVERLLNLIGAPHLRIPAVHIAGTKGKGSTAAMIDSALRYSGIRTGLFTSPHIEQFEERMRVNGNIPSPERIAKLVSRLRDMLRAADVETADRIPTFFEVTTLMAWMLFDEEQVEIAVLETGMGGRLDCTNVCRPLVTVITSIGMDHTHILGDTLEKIAAEKAGIIKNGVPVVQGQLPGEADAEVRTTAERRGCQRYVCGRDFAWSEAEVPPESSSTRRRTQSVQIITPTQTLNEVSIPLLGKHQAHNASLAAMACELVQQSGWTQVTAHSIIEGIRTTQWPLRFEVLDGHPTIVLDAAHNSDSMRAVAQVLTGQEWKNRRRILIFAVSSDKDAVSMLQAILPHFDEVVLTRFLTNPRSVPTDQLLTLATEIQPALNFSSLMHTAEGPGPAIEMARALAGPAGVVVITGSIFLAAEARGLLLLPSKP